MTAAQITRFISKSKKPFSIYADFLGRCCVWQTYALHQQHHRIPHPQPKYTESKKKKFRKLNECKSINLLGLSSTNKVPARILCGKIGKSAEFKVLLTELFLLRSFAFCFPNISVRLKKKKWIYLLSYHSKFTNAAASTEPSQKWAKNREREKKWKQATLQITTLNVGKEKTHAHRPNERHTNNNNSNKSEAPSPAPPRSQLSAVGASSMHIYPFIWFLVRFVGFGLG